MRRIGLVHVLLTVVVALVLLLPTMPARAAGYGPGFDVGLGRIGAYITPLGTQAYCLEIAKDRPLGATDAGTVGGWAGLGPADLTRLNWVLHTYGQSPDPVVTAAVNLFVWSIADPGTYGSHGMSGDDYYSGRAGGARGAVLAKLAELRAAAPPEPGSLEVELGPDLTGRVRVHDPAGAGAELIITGADAVGPVAVTDGAVIDFTAAPGDSRRAVVEARARFAAASYPAMITVHDSGPGQHLAGPAGTALEATARADVSLEFHPMLQSSVAQTVVGSGDPATDVLTVGVASDSPAPWRSGSSVLAAGTLYGPFAERPQEAAEPPVNAPVAWTETIELSGPGEVTTSGGFRPAEPGFYTWVWSFSAGSQPAGSLLPDGYRWADRFGLPNETFEVVEPLPATGADDDPALWLIAIVAVGAGVGLLRIASGPPGPRPGRSRHRRSAVP